MMTKWQLPPRPRAPVLRVGAALPDPPFEFMTKNGPAGFDIALMKRIAEILGREWQLVAYEGGDFNGIFGGLDDGRYDCVASGTTVTPGRNRRFLCTLCDLGPIAHRRRRAPTECARHRRPQRPGDRRTAGQYQPTRCQ